ncbi:YxeA family protein [Brochothrix campestris]|uniref:YxeA family protein n=1 Tax=Brochothrix campestris FSL F6-1037 TaxID=1265861 RepID=W7CNX7_9LIST|nr:YxeA family protein [Brochothrix campestris]EUJ38385.1 hypothetical protein BCAMP_08966 [Brochothrix campestris FSL F6-1037]
MKAIKALLILVLIIGAVLGGALFFTKNSSSEFAALIDQLNPLVQESVLYVKTTEAESINGYGTATYSQTGAKANGNTRPISFTADHELKRDHYLELSTKGGHVNTYNEVPRDKVPVAAREALN